MKSFALLKVSRFIIALAIVLSTFASQVHADALRIGDRNGLWLDGIRIIRVQDGNIDYTLRGNRRSANLQSISGIRLDNAPTLTKAVELTDATDSKPDDVLKAWNDARKEVKDDWVVNWIDRQITDYAGRQSKPKVAIEAYLRLLQSGETSLFDPLPLSVVGVVNDEQRVELVALLKKAEADGLEEEAERRAKRLRTEMEELISDGSGVTVSSFPVSSAMPANDPVTVMLKRGDVTRAKELAKEKLNDPGEAGSISLRLYQLGLAELYLAEANKSETRLKDAGLSFARVSVYYTGGTYSGPATLELGYVHHKLGRYDLAERFYDRAKEALDKDSEPELVNRLNQLQKQLLADKRQAGNE